MEIDRLQIDWNPEVDAHVHSVRLSKNDKGTFFVTENGSDFARSAEGELVMGDSVSWTNIYPDKVSALTKLLELIKEW